MFQIWHQSCYAPLTVTTMRLIFLAALACAISMTTAKEMKIPKYFRQIDEDFSQLLVS